MPHLDEVNDGVASLTESAAAQCDVHRVCHPLPRAGGSQARPGAHWGSSALACHLSLSSWSTVPPLGSRGRNSSMPAGSPMHRMFRWCRRRCG